MNRTYNKGIIPDERSLMSEFGDIFDISAYNLTEGQPTQYADLEAALNSGSNVPEGVRAGGMSVKFINSSTGKYEQWRLMAASWSTNVSDWQGVDSTPTAGSQNLVTSGGVYDNIKVISDAIYGDYDYVQVPLSIETGMYYNTQAGGTEPYKVNDYTDPDSNYSCTELSVQEGDKFKISGLNFGTNVQRLWAFADAQDNRLSCSYYDVWGQGEYITDEEIIAPANATRLVINFRNYNLETDGLKKFEKTTEGLLVEVDDLEQRVAELENRQFDVIDTLNSNSSNDALSAKQGKILADEIYGEGAYQDIDISSLLEENYYYNTQRSPEPYKVSSTPEPVADLSISCFKINVSAGEKYKLFGKGYPIGYVLMLYAVADSDGVRLDTSGPGADYSDGHEITIPAGASYMVVNFQYYDSSTYKIQKYVEQKGLKDKVVDCEQGIEDCENAIEDIYKALKGKSIVVFGDSLTEFKQTGTNKSWCDYANEITGANFINVAIGGTQIKQRAKYISLFNENTNYEQNDWVFYKPAGGTMNWYNCINAHSAGAWNANDFEEVQNYNSNVYSTIDIINMVHAACTGNYADQQAAVECIKDHPSIYSDNNTEIINRFIAIDWSSIDYVIIEGGANDFNDSVGTYDWHNGSTNRNQTPGAINIIVDDFCSTFKNIPLIFVSPVVRWWNYGATHEVEDWCDNYTAGGTMTYKQFVGSVINEFSINHIQCKDMYNIGWNQYNFSRYFPTGESTIPNYDGTHPRKGFDIMGKIISNFLVINKQ